jgi:(p)ppGpp synthase/HD superfamily hydrolase
MRGKRSLELSSVFRFFSRYRTLVHLQVELEYQPGRLADLVQLLAHGGAFLTDLNPDRAPYRMGLAEASTEVTFLVKGSRHAEEIIKKLKAAGFRYRF